MSTGFSRAGVAVVVVALQVIAAIYFILDGAAEGFAVTDIVVAVALLAGVVLGGLAVRRLLTEAHRRERALRVARGALSELITERFREWRLSPAEADVALFALKGCPVAEIAAMRGAAQGTVRAQLSQIYAKAGVTNQTMLLAVFLDVLIDPLMPNEI